MPRLLGIDDDQRFIPPLPGDDVRPLLLGLPDDQLLLVSGSAVKGERSESLATPKALLTAGPKTKQSTGGEADAPLCLAR
jgi:hypothetical protein